MTIKVPKISIIIPSFNKVKYIKRTIDSIISQNYPNFEIIIMDGGSTDGTQNVIKEFVKRYPEFIKYESKKDKGQWDAINKGFRQAKGKIVSYINADDEYLPGAFSEIERMYRANIDAFWFVGRGRVVDGEGKRIARWTTFYKNFLLFLNLKPLLLITNYLMQPSVFITKTTWIRFGPFTGYDNFVLEYDLWLRISNLKMPVITDKYLSSFRIEPGTISASLSEKLLGQDEKILRKYTKNPLILMLHKLHNIGRLIVVKIV
jgi:glycosyltransferase involved in cell wall biosynthesis